MGEYDRYTLKNVQENALKQMEKTFSVNHKTLSNFVYFLIIIHYAITSFSD